ncbi:TPA: helix-turn-helix domain-containing protein [Streptococcus suis]
MILGDIIKDFRQKNKLTMDSFASLSGLTKGYISMLEKNQHPKTKKALLPTLETLEKVARGMDIDVSELVSLLDSNQEIALTVTPQQFQLFQMPLHPQVQFLDRELRDEFHSKWIAFGQDQLNSMSAKQQSSNLISLDDFRDRVELAVPGKVSAGTGYWQDADFNRFVSFYTDDLPTSTQYDTIAQVVGDSMSPLILDGDYLFIKLTSSIPMNSIGIFSVNGENFVKKFKGDYLQSLNPDYDDIYFTEDDEIRTIGQVVEIISNN